MIDDLHIVDFCKDVGRIFLMLYRLFPREQELYVGDLIGFEEPDEYGLYSKRHESCLSTLIWLKTEGWIRFENIVRREAVDQCVLTQRAFVSLHQSLPAALRDKHFNVYLSDINTQAASPLDGLHLATKAQDSAALYATVMQLLSNHEV